MLIYDVPTAELEARLAAKRAEFKEPGKTPIEKFRLTSDCNIIISAINWRKRWVDHPGVDVEKFGQPDGVL